MKKISALLLVFCLIFTAVPGVLAAETDVIGELILSVKERTGISDEEYDFETYYENTYNDITTYSFSWKNKSVSSDYIRAEVKNDGEIVSYSKTNRNDYSAKFLKHSKDDAKAFALKFLEKIGAPNEISDPEVTKYGSNYRVYFQRIHDAVEVSGNYISCTVSGESGEVVRYDLSWTEGLEFKEVTPVTFEKAKEIYKTELGYELFYTVKTEDNKASAGLVYKPRYEESAYIDALSGEVKTYTELMETNSKLEAAESASGGSSADEARLSEKELELLGELEGLISTEEAVETAKNTEEFEIDESYTLESANVYKRNDGKYTISIFMISEDNNKVSGYKNISYDGETGNILGYNSYSYFEGEAKENIINDEEGRKTAENFLKKYYPEEFADAVLVNKLTEREGTYEYKRTVNGIKVSNNGYSVSINLKTGKMTRFSRTMTELSFPGKDNIQSVDKVYDKLLTEKNLRMRYMIVPKDNNGKQNTPVLVYSLENSPTYDANTLSEISSYTLEPLEKPVKPEYTDISGHYAEERIKRLLEEDIYLEGNEFMPDKAITYKEFASLLYMTLSGSEPRPLNDLYKSAESYLDLNVSEEKPDEPITRLEAVKMLLDKMGYKEFAAIEGIFNCRFTDIEEKDKGYVAIAAGLKLISTADTLFYKDDYLKRCDAFIIIYNYMAR